jgi:two-component system, cell cycle sensor histidine kinase and response regulator CckA
MMTSAGTHDKTTDDLCAGSAALPAGSILVLDDEKLIRDTVESMLRHLGYQVTTCATGEEAIALYTNAVASGAPYRAVIMDLTIVGGMGGKDAARQILLFDPAAQLIVSSGYSDDPVMADPKRYGFQALLAKPYQLSGMSELLSSLLSS